MKNSAKAPLAHLALADPKLAETLSDGIEKRRHPLPPGLLDDMVDFILRSISLEISFGESVARSLASLVENADPKVLKRFQSMVDSAANTGPSLGKLMATHSVPILKTTNPGLLEKFLAAVGVMHARGLHTLYEPLACVAELISAGDISGADAFLDLAKDTFARDLSYGLTRHFAHALPTAALSFKREKRSSLLRQLRQVMETDTSLVDAFLEGISRGLIFLSNQSLETFVSRGLRKAAENPAAGRNFLSLSSAVAQIARNKLQTAVPLTKARFRLQRYLQARMGSRLTVKSMSDLPVTLRQSHKPPALVCTDGRSLFLTDIMDRYESQTKNMALYQTLVRLESAHIEFGTFNFDIERFREAHPELPLNKTFDNIRRSDFTLFFALFPNPNLAEDIFTIFEHGRVFLKAAARYPGLVHRAMPVLKEELRACFSHAPGDPRMLLYAGVMLGWDEAIRWLEVSESPETLKACCSCLDKAGNGLVESTARCVMDAYPQLVNLLNLWGQDTPFSPPYGRRIRPDLFDSACRHLDPLIDRLQVELRSQGRKVFRSDIRRQLLETDGRLSHESLSAILAPHRFSGKTDPEPTADLYGRLAERMPDLFHPARDTHNARPSAENQVFWYREWSAPIGDYLDRHVRLVEHTPAGHAEDMFDSVLKNDRGMVLNIRRAFELLKPQELTLLHHWPDGDDIDMPALMAAKTERKAGHLPSDRLYLKRAKQVRDVAVLLLVDLSGSTKNLVPGTSTSVLAVEKQAIVLFCEALRVVGDDFSVAGFSGRGRLQVDYYRYKDFESPVTRKVRRRISGMTPQRSTRTGAALRHGVRVLSQRPSKVRLLILLSDGYPNDTGYKRDTAVSDVQKAVAEANSRGIHVRPITVNLSAEKNLDSLFGSLHHNVISDVRQLPDTLWRIYCALTK